MARTSTSTRTSTELHRFSDAAVAADSNLAAAAEGMRNIADNQEYVERLGKRGLRVVPTDDIAAVLSQLHLWTGNTLNAVLEPEDDSLEAITELARTRNKLDGVLGL